MPRAVNGPTMLAFRAEDNSIHYVPAPSAYGASTYDSDGEPLISGSSESHIDEEALQNFTATGRPAPIFKANPLQSLAGDMYSLPQLLPKQYTDDSIIPAIVTNVIPMEKPEEGSRGRRRSLLGILKKEKKDGGKRLVKVIYMPRRDYKKFFARGLQGEYIGSEPERQWTEQELEEQFGKYRPVYEKRKFGA